MNSARTIALLTDFGYLDPFSGILKGVIAKIAAGISIVDITHGIPPGDVRRAAIVLWQSRIYFPAGTIFLCVVDPGVGTARRGIILKVNEHVYIGPDNGIFTFILGEEYQAWEIRNPDYALPEPGITFHGRDIFSPAAAHIAQGVSPYDFGPSIYNLFLLPNPVLEYPSAGILNGEILFADHFGNLLTSFGRFIQRSGRKYEFQPWLKINNPMTNVNTFSLKDWQLSLPNGFSLPLAHTFTDIPEGKIAGLVGSSGLLEIAANRQSAADQLGLRERTPVILKHKEIPHAKTHH